MVFFGITISFPGLSEERQLSTADIKTSLVLNNNYLSSYLPVKVDMESSLFCLIMRIVYEKVINPNTEHSKLRTSFWTF